MNVGEIVNHYLRSIDKAANNEERLLHCITKLYNLPVTVQHLQETGIGRTVNNLRKFDGEVGVTAKALVTKWKAMVAAAESSENEEEDAEEEEEEDNGKSEDDEHTSPDVKSPQIITITLKDRRPSESSKNHHHHHHNHHDGGGSSSSRHHKDNRDHKKSSSSAEHYRSSDKDREKKSSSSDRHRDHKERDHKKSSSTSSSSHQISKSSSISKPSSHNHALEKTSSSTSSHHKHKQQKQRSSTASSSSSSSSEDEDDSSGLGESDNENDKLIMDVDIKPVVESPKKSKSEHRSSSSHHTKSSSSSNHHHNHVKIKEEIKEEPSSSREKSSKDKHRSHHNSSSSSSHHKNSHSSSGHKSSSSSKHTSEKEKPKSESDDDLKPKSSSSSSRKEKSSRSDEKSKSHRSEKKSSDGSKSLSTVKIEAPTTTPPPPAKPTKKRKPEVAENENGDIDGMDNTQGASFADALGWLEKPAKIKKKSMSSPAPSTSSVTPALSTSSSTSSSSSSKKSRPTPSTSTAPILPYSSASFSIPPTPPSLLASSFKLKPLDDLSLELAPAISTNYKPMPLNPVIMDCVFQNNRPVKKVMTEDEALGVSISSKNLRTKVYSGNKSTAILPVPPLLEMCIRVLQKNIDALEYTGGVPFDILKPVLDRASPEQLFTFEHFNPYLMEDSDMLWQGHCSRKFKAHKRQEYETWREMYIRCLEEQEARLTHLTENIKQSQTACVPVKQTKMAYIDSAAKPPRNVQRQQTQHGTSRKLIATPAARVPSLSAVTNNIAKIGDTRLKVARGLRDPAQVTALGKPRKAPLMAKAMQLCKGQFKR